eukprot:6007446-Prorocentrum_lima.AAC.1
MGYKAADQDDEEASPVLEYTAEEGDQASVVDQVDLSHEELGDDGLDPGDDEAALLSYMDARSKLSHIRR